MKATFTIQFGELGYIADPYWPEIERIFQLEKAARVHPKHGADKKRTLIETYCNDHQISLKELDEARHKIATEKWYRNSEGNIMIPRHQFAGCLVQSLKDHSLKASVSKDAFRSFVTVGDLVINPVKTEADGKFERYVKNPETNLRRLQSDEYVNNFTATGDVHFAESVVQPEALESLIRFSGEWVGIGSSRKMGRGKYSLIKFTAPVTA